MPSRVVTENPFSFKKILIAVLAAFIIGYIVGATRVSDKAEGRTPPTTVTVTKEGE